MFRQLAEAAVSFTMVRHPFERWITKFYFQHHEGTFPSIVKYRHKYTVDKLNLREKIIEYETLLPATCFSVGYLSADPNKPSKVHVFFFFPYKGVTRVCTQTLLSFCLHRVPVFTHSHTNSHPQLQTADYKHSLLIINFYRRLGVTLVSLSLRMYNWKKKQLKVLSSEMDPVEIKLIG